MPLTKTSKVGILTIVALIALSLIIVWKTDLFLMRQGYELTGSFNNIEGLTIGSEVRYRGFKVGKVVEIDPGPLDIKVYSIISGQIKFPEDSQLRVSYDGIVGLKFLEIKPGTSEVVYQPNEMIYGIKTSGIVDFVDIGAQNLQESKKILQDIRAMIEDPKLKAALYDTIYTANKVANELEQVARGIREIVADPKFQSAFKGTVDETEKTLSSANRFFESFGKLNLRTSGGVDIGSRANAVRGDVDIVQGQNNYLRFGLGEGPSRQPSLLDILFTSKLYDDFGFRLGIMSNQLGGGLAYYPSDKIIFRGDIYDINNPRPNWPKFRLSYGYLLKDYMDFNVTADDILNAGQRNLMVGIKVKPPDDKIY